MIKKCLHCFLLFTEEVGDLDKIKRVVKLVSFVNCVDGFTQQPAVINGASDTIGKVFGDKGIHARSAVSTNALPLNVAVKVETIVEIEDWTSK
ncbi:YjgF/chorismate mutase-like putative endoribonuclease [Phytophthora infestans]|uniref:Putative YjgF/chorismate mutase-like endoribonuclease n=1 Tax=Phytophthora infestans TaxID=4787 RepID=A0A833T6D7_PHYIN|nr:YjgF/chorismate mutase-like putative endoribonuclease [Phytophthora infestans]KAF4148495.1 putative YjgF/chorismate mutase-like endoribonuclease [Phytophthora infestans]